MRWKSILVSVLIVAAAVIWMYGGNIGNDDVRKAAIAKEQAEKPKKNTDVLPFLVQVALSETKMFSTQIRISGRTKALRESHIKSETTATVQSVAVADGDTVKAGDILVELSEGSLRSNYAAALAASESAKKNLKAMDDLSNSGYQSEIELLRAKETMARAQSNVNSAKNVLDDTRITAPFDGVLLDVAVELGDFVSPGMLVAKLIDLNPIEVSAYISEQEFSSVQIGQTARIRLVSGAEYEGKVSYISSSSDIRTATFEVRIQIVNPDYAIPEGMSADVTILTQQVPAHYQSKSVLTLNNVGDIGVKSVDEAGKVVFTPAKIVDDTDEGVYLGGLPDRIQLIVSGQDFVKEGTIVRTESVQLSAE